MDNHTSIPSPCTGICKIGNDGWCLGCRRSLAEIAAWPSLDNEAKRAIRRRIETRGGKSRELKPPPCR